MKHIIAGVDPGKRAAVACIDLDCNVVHLATGMFVGVGWFVEHIARSGSPVVIASDRREPDDMPRKLAAIFGATLFASGYDISVKRKHEIARTYKVGSQHERDALSAAISAYNSYKNKLNQAEVFSRKNGLADSDMVKAMVIKRYSMHEAMNEKMVSSRSKRT